MVSLNNGKIKWLNLFSNVFTNTNNDYMVLTSKEPINNKKEDNKYCIRVKINKCNLPYHTMVGVASEPIESDTLYFLGDATGPGSIGFSLEKNVYCEGELNRHNKVCKEGDIITIDGDNTVVKFSVNGEFVYKYEFKFKLKEVYLAACTYCYDEIEILNN